MCLFKIMLSSFYSVHSDTLVTYCTASKLPASVSDSLHLYCTGMPNIPQLFAINAERHSVLFFVLARFSELYGMASHTMVCMQERGHMHVDDIVQHADKFQVTLCSQK